MSEINIIYKIKVGFAFFLERIARGQCVNMVSPSELVEIWFLDKTKFHIIYAKGVVKSGWGIKSFGKNMLEMGEIMNLMGYEIIQREIYELISEGEAK